MIPVFAGIFVSWFDLMQCSTSTSAWFWKNIVGRLLLGTVPGTWAYPPRTTPCRAPTATTEAMRPYAVLGNQLTSCWLTPDLDRRGRRRGDDLRRDPPAPLARRRLSAMTTVHSMHAIETEP